MHSFKKLNNLNPNSHEHGFVGYTKPTNNNRANHGDDGDITPLMTMISVPLLS
jgi:hypothetical protein